MLLAIDMGNTQTAMGLFDGDELVQSWRMPTDRSYTADEIHVRLMGFFKMYGLSLDAVDAIAFAGVVPQLSREWHAVADRIAADAIVIGPQTAAVMVSDVLAFAFRLPMLQIPVPGLYRPLAWPT